MTVALNAHERVECADLTRAWLSASPLISEKDNQEGIAWATQERCNLKPFLLQRREHLFKFQAEVVALFNQTYVALTVQIQKAIDVFKIAHKSQNQIESAAVEILDQSSSMGTQELLKILDKHVNQSAFSTSIEAYLQASEDAGFHQRQLQCRLHLLAQIGEHERPCKDFPVACEDCFRDLSDRRLSCDLLHRDLTKAFALCTQVECGVQLRNLYTEDSLAQGWTCEIPNKKANNVCYQAMASSVEAWPEGGREVDALATKEAVQVATQLCTDKTFNRLHSESSLKAIANTTLSEVSKTLGALTQGSSDKHEPPSGTRTRSLEEINARAGQLDTAGFLSHDGFRAPEPTSDTPWVDGMGRRIASYMLPKEQYSSLSIPMKKTSEQRRGGKGSSTSVVKGAFLHEGVVALREHSTTWFTILSKASDQVYIGRVILRHSWGNSQWFLDSGDGAPITYYT